MSHENKRILAAFPMFLPVGECDPMEIVDQKMSENGVDGLTIVGGLSYPMLRYCVEFLKVFDQEGLKKYHEIKGVDGTKTPESRREAYAFAWKRVGEHIAEHYNRTFTASSKNTEGEEWKVEGEQE